MIVPFKRRDENTNTGESTQGGRKQVTVVGGSAAGLLTACLLARAGQSVQVLESAEHLAPAQRTLIVTHRMRTLLGPSADGCVRNEIRRFELFTDGRAAQVPLHKPDLIIERAALIRGLAEQAQLAGAQLFCGRRFQRLEGTRKGIALEVERCRDGGREELAADAVVGGDGAASRVAQAAGWPKLDTVPLIQAIVPLPKDMRRDTVRVWFIPQDTPYFYWLIPESPTRG